MYTGLPPELLGAPTPWVTSEQFDLTREDLDSQFKRVLQTFAMHALDKTDHTGLMFAKYAVHCYFSQEYWRSLHAYEEKFGTGKLDDKRLILIARGSLVPRDGHVQVLVPTNEIHGPIHAPVKIVAEDMEVHVPFIFKYAQAYFDREVIVGEQDLRRLRERCSVNSVTYQVC